MKAKMRQIYNKVLEKSDDPKDKDWQWQPKKGWIKDYEKKLQNQKRNHRGEVAKPTAINRQVDVDMLKIKPNPNHRPKPARKTTVFPNVRWVIPDEVIGSARPGYNWAGLRPHIVDNWLRKVMNGIGTKPKSIIMFLTDRELGRFYNFDLVKAYRKRGIKVYRVPTSDPVYANIGFGAYDQTYDPGPTFSFRSLNKIKEIIEIAPKPVLIHCSAGMDRTGMVERYLKFINKDKLDALRGNVEVVGEYRYVSCYYGNGYAF